MIELKFRGKLLKDSNSFKTYKKGTIIQGGFCSQGIKTFIVAHSNVFEVEPESVSQFTGLQDKNGTDVYEGDYLRHKESIFRIDYSELDFGFVFWHPELKQDLGLPYFKGLKDFEVIGNIHETLLNDL